MTCPPARRGQRGGRGRDGERLRGTLLPSPPAPCKARVQGDPPGPRHSPAAAAAAGLPCAAGGFIGGSAGASLGGRDPARSGRGVAQTGVLLAPSAPRAASRSVRRLARQCSSRAAAGTARPPALPRVASARAPRGLIAAGGGGPGRGRGSRAAGSVPAAAPRTPPSPPRAAGTALATRAPGNRGDARSPEPGLQPQIFTRHFPRAP